MFIVLAATAGIYSWFFFTPDKNVNGLYLVPKDAMYIVETARPMDGWNRFSKSDVWKFLKQQPYFREIGENADYLDSLIHENQVLFDLFGSRDVIISAHKTRLKDYDFLFLVNLKKGSKIGFIEETIEGLLNQSGYRVSNSEFKNKTIITAFDDQTRETLFFSIVQNYLVCSYSGQLVESAIMEVEAPGLGRNEDFLNIYKETSEDGLCKLYIHYAFIDEFMQCYSNETDPMVKDLSRTLLYSGLKVEVEDEYIDLEGYTNLNDTLDSYLRALLLSGKGSVTAPEILPARTAIYHTMGFENGIAFYKNLQKVLQTDEQNWNQFEKSKNQIESLLKIDLERDIMSWVADEVAYVRNEPSKYTEHLDDILVVMKANSIQYARERLDFIAEQVKKRTPAKFRKVDYKNYTIKYLDIKDMFRLFFGKMFSKMEKPYYTMVADYVVFSNNPATLVSLIEDYEAGATLENVSEFSEFRDKFNRESTVFSYVASSKAFPLMVNRMDAITRTSAMKNEVYFRSFPAAGFQITEKEDKFYTRARLEFIPYKPDTTLDSDTAEMEEDARMLLDSLDDIQKFLLSKFEHNVIRDYYGTSDKLRLEAETKRGRLHGKYREFYESGALKVFGHHRKGEKKGVWYYYNMDGSLQRKERYGFIGKLLGDAAAD